MHLIVGTGQRARQRIIGLTPGASPAPAATRAKGAGKAQQAFHLPNRPEEHRRHRVPGITFCTQATGNGVTVAELKRLLRLLPAASKTVETNETDDFPELDGAPGGILDPYGIIAKALQDKGGKTDLRHPIVRFVPSAPEESELDEFLLLLHRHRPHRDHRRTLRVERLP